MAGPAPDSPRPRWTGNAIWLVFLLIAAVTLTGCQGASLHPTSPPPPAGEAKVPLAPSAAAPVALPPPPRLDKFTVASVSPSGRTVVGVGMPVTVVFNRNVARSSRADVERALMVTTTKQVSEGSWRWVGKRTVQYRPRSYWPGHTDITVTAALGGVRAGKNLEGVKTIRRTFRTGTSRVALIDARRLRMTVREDGKVVRTMPVSLGKQGYRTRSGVKVVMESYRVKRMRSSTVGIGGAERYDLKVPYAVRITTSGEFIHGAPWNPSIGEAHVSHGCTNLRLGDAKWFMAWSQYGDVVETTGTGRGMEPWNGVGGVWNMPWSKWKRGSALV